MAGGFDALRFVVGDVRPPRRHIGQVVGFDRAVALANHVAASRKPQPSRKRTNEIRTTPLAAAAATVEELFRDVDRETIMPATMRTWTNKLAAVLFQSKPALDGDVADVDRLRLGDLSVVNMALGDHSASGLPSNRRISASLDLLRAPEGSNRVTGEVIPGQVLPPSPWRNWAICRSSSAIFAFSPAMVEGRFWVEFRALVFVADLQLRRITTGWVIRRR